MPTSIYQSLYQNFIRQGFAKSFTQGYAQSVIAATHPHSQNRPTFARRGSNRFSRLQTLQLQSAFHTGSAGVSEHRHEWTASHGGLDAYFENLRKKQAAEEGDREWVQFEFQRSLEWKPTDGSAPLAAEPKSDSAEALEATQDGDATAQDAVPADAAAALAHIDAAIEKEIEVRNQLEDGEAELWSSRAPTPAAADEIQKSRAVTPVSRTRTPASIARTATPPVDPQSRTYADHLTKLSETGRYAEIPAVFEAMLVASVRPIASAYNALLMAAIHLPSKKIEIVSKALDVYADMLQRKIAPDSDTFNILVGLLASRSLEVSALKKTLEDKRVRYGGMDEPGKFMLTSHELEHAILSEDDRLDLAIKLFDSSVTSQQACYSPETYHQLISACAQGGRLSDMLQLFEHMEASKVTPFAATFPAMITAFAHSGDLISAVECYAEYRELAISHDKGEPTLLDRLDLDVYAAVINAYVVSDKLEGAKKFYARIIQEYGVRAADMKDALVSGGFVKGFTDRGIYESALQWAQTVENETRGRTMSQVATLAADSGDMHTAVAAFANLPQFSDEIAHPTMALLALSVRNGDVAAASKYWQILSSPDVRATPAFIDTTAMYAVAMLGSGHVLEALTQSEMMFERIRQTCQDGASIADEIEEGVEFIARYMAERDIADPREAISVVSPQVQSFVSSPYASTPTVSSFEDSFDPYAHNTDFKGSSLISDDLDGSHGRKKPRLNDALARLRNIRRTGRHPRYVTYAKLISAAAREGRMNQCYEILDMARKDVPLQTQYAVVRYGWSSILDAMVGACLTLGNRGMAEQFHQDLLSMGATPSANTFGLYITTLKESTKTFDEASEAVKIFRRAKEEGVEPTSFLYNALIGKLGKARRIDDCMLYFAEMRKLGIKPTSVTYGTIVNALCRVSDEKFAEELFNEMEEMPNYKARPAPYNSMMQFFLTTKRDKTKVLAYHDRMLAKGIAPTAHTYKLLVDTHATLEPVDMAAAESVLDKIRASGQHVEPVHYASLIHARGCNMHDMEGARKVFDSVLRDTAVAPAACLFQALFEAMVANHRVADTEPVLAEMRAKGIELTPYIANTLIHGWAAEKNIEKAEKVYEAVGMEPREPSTYEAMTRAYLAAEEREKARGVVSEMLGRGYPSAVAGKVLDLLSGAPTAAEEAAAVAA